MEFLLALIGIAGIAILSQSKSPLPSEANFKQAKNKLTNNPDDPDANTIVGKYTAFVLGDYPTAIPLLAKSSDRILKGLADHELDSEYVDTAIKKIRMGDDWVTAAKNFQPLYRTFYERASQWYALAWPDVDGIWKDRLRERLRKMLLLPGSAGAVRKGVPIGWTTDGQKNFIDSTIAHRGGKSARLEGGKEKNVFGNSGISSPIIVAPKGQVTFTAWVASDETYSPNDRIVVNLFGQNGSFITNVGPFLPADNPFWQKLEAKLDIPKEVARISVAVLLHSTKGVIWVDDVSLKWGDKELIENGSFEK